jgi:pimeloyl-ACP methyl ester carboxylesterase
MTDLSDIQFDHAQIGGVRLHYAKAGDGGRLVLLLHGFPEFWYSWRHQLKELADEYTVVAPDLRGFNLSDKPKHISDYKVEKIVDDVIGLIHHFGQKDAAIIGHDWGGMVAWSAAANHPEHVWKVGALQVPPASVWRKNFGFRQLLASWYMFFFQLPVIPEYLLSLSDYTLLERAMKRSTARPDVLTSGDIAEYKKAWSEPDALTSMINYYRANIPARMLSRSVPATKIKVPSLFIYGEKDRAILHDTVKGIGEVIEAPFADIRIADSGHWVQQEAKDEVTAVIRDFLSSREA